MLGEDHPIILCSIQGLLSWETSTFKTTTLKTSTFKKLRLVALAELVELVLEYWYWSEPEVLVPGGTGTGGSTSATRRSF